MTKLEEDIKSNDDQLKKEQSLVTDAKRERDDASNAQVRRDVQIRKLDQELITLRNLCLKGEKEFDVKEMEINKIKEMIESDSKKLTKMSIIDIKLRKKRETVHKLQKDLMQLRAERSAMEEELSIPINIHNWTLLESSDPVLFEKLKTYQQLQSDLVLKTAQVTELQELIDKKSVDYLDLKSQAQNLEFRKSSLEKRTNVELSIPESSQLVKKQKIF